MEPAMLNENPNDFHWKNKLDDADALSGETLADKNAAWEKLHSRLRQKPRRIRAVWYWVAAACLLLAVVIPFIAVNKKQDAMLKNNAVKTQQERTTPALILPLKENKVASVSSTASQKKNAVKQPSETIKAGDIIINIAEKGEQPVPDLMDQQIMVDQQTAASVAVVDTTLSTRMVPAALARIFKVVHINELGDPVEVTADMVRNADLHAFQLKLATQEVYKNPAVASNKSILTGSKPKTSPN